jgi:hypothetical protein
VTVDWEDDWPIFNGGKSISIITSSHSEKEKITPPFVWSPDFTKPELEPGWYQKRTLSQDPPNEMVYSPKYIPNMELQILL